MAKKKMKKYATGTVSNLTSQGVDIGELRKLWEQWNSESKGAKTAPIAQAIGQNTTNSKDPLTDVDIFNSLNPTNSLGLNYSSTDLNPLKAVSNTEVLSSTTSPGTAGAIRGESANMLAGLTSPKKGFLGIGDGKPGVAGVGKGGNFGKNIDGGAYALIGQILGNTSVGVTSGSGNAKTRNTGRVVGGALKGAGTGASIGSMFSPLGTAIGAGVGALAGTTIGAIQNKKGKKRDRARLRDFTEDRHLELANAIDNAGLTRNVAGRYDATGRAGELSQYDILQGRNAVKNSVTNFRNNLQYIKDGGTVKGYGDGTKLQFNGGQFGGGGAGGNLDEESAMRENMISVKKKLKSANFKEPEEKKEAQGLMEMIDKELSSYGNFNKAVYELIRQHPYAIAASAMSSAIAKNFNDGTAPKLQTGVISGPGTSTSDSILAPAEPGATVFNNNPETPQGQVIGNLLLALLGQQPLDADRQRAVVSAPSNYDNDRQRAVVSAPSNYDNDRQRAVVSNTRTIQRPLARQRAVVSSLADGTVPVKLSAGEIYLSKGDTQLAKGMLGQNNFNALVAAANPNAKQSISKKHGGKIRKFADGTDPISFKEYIESEEILKIPEVQAYLDMLIKLEADPKDILHGQNPDSTAKGAFQFIERTGEVISNKYDIKNPRDDDATLEDQQIAALALMYDNKMKYNGKTTNALELISSGKKDAIKAATKQLAEEIRDKNGKVIKPSQWASLPGGPQQGYSQLNIEEGFNTSDKEFEDAFYQEYNNSLETYGGNSPTKNTDSNTLQEYKYGKLKDTYQPGTTKGTTEKYESWKAKIEELKKAEAESKKKLDDFNRYQKEYKLSVEKTRQALDWPLGRARPNTTEEDNLFKKEHERHKSQFVKDTEKAYGGTNQLVMQAKAKVAKEYKQTHNEYFNNKDKEPNRTYNRPYKDDVVQANFGVFKKQFDEAIDVATAEFESNKQLRKRLDNYFNGKASLEEKEELLKTYGSKETISKMRLHLRDKLKSDETNLSNAKLSQRRLSVRGKGDDPDNYGSIIPTPLGNISIGLDGNKISPRFLDMELAGYKRRFKSLTGGELLEVDEYRENKEIQDKDDTSTTENRVKVRTHEPRVKENIEPIPSSSTDITKLAGLIPNTLDQTPEAKPSTEIDDTTTTATATPQTGVDKLGGLAGIASLVQAGTGLTNAIIAGNQTEDIIDRFPQDNVPLNLLTDYSNARAEAARAKGRAQVGLTAAEKALANNSIEQAYRTTVANAKDGGAGASLRRLGAKDKYDAILKLAAVDAGASDQRFQIAENVEQRADAMSNQLTGYKRRMYEDQKQKWGTELNRSTQIEMASGELMQAGISNFIQNLSAKEIERIRTENMGNNMNTLAALFTNQNR